MKALKFLWTSNFLFIVAILSALMSVYLYSQGEPVAKQNVVTVILLAGAVVHDIREGKHKQA